MRTRPFLFLAALAALILAGVWYCAPQAGHRPAGSPGISRPPEISSPAASAPPKQTSPRTPAKAGEEPSHLADGLNASSGDIHADLRILNEVFRQYRSAVHALNPVGENVDIVAVLTGRNPLEFAFIPPNHPAINAQGELCDRWGTPFFFHQLSGTQMEIHSAGPDRQLWTADDIVLTPGLSTPRL